MSIALEADSLALGESVQIYCDYCDNCKPYAPSLSITRVDAGAVFHCFRASCGAKGFVPVKGTPRLSIGKKKNDDSINRYHLYTYELIPIIGGWSVSIPQEKLSEQGVLYNNTLGTVAFPVYDYFGKQYGWVDRSYNGRQPKAINYIDDSQPRVHYPIQEWIEGYALYLVEDVVSSIRMSKFVNCASILGTHLDVNQLIELRKRTKEIVMVLDPDAADKAVQHSCAMRALFDKVSVKFFSKDPKDMTDIELLKEIG